MDTRGSVLFVEDNKNLCDLVKFRIEKAGYEVLTACDGVEGLRKSYLVDIVVLDLGLPLMSGDEVLAEMRKSGLLTPVLIASGSKDGEIREKVESLGVVDFIQKPYKLNYLMSRIDANMNVGRDLGRLNYAARDSIKQIDSLLLSLQGSGILTNNYD